MIDLEQGRPEVSRGDLIVFEDGTDQPPSFLVYDLCKDKGDRPVFRGLWNSNLGQMGAVILVRGRRPGGTSLPRRRS